MTIRPEDPIQLRGVTIPHRLWLSPMCMYSSTGAPEGGVTDWHVSHLEARAVGGAALAMVEATAVHPDGRVSPSDLGAWSDEHIRGLSRLAGAATRHGAVPGLQLGHAGAKASTRPPWHGRRIRVRPHEGGWIPLAPEPSTDGAAVRALTHAEVTEIPDLFAQATRRAAVAGFQVLEVHAAHGYLLHEFLSPLTNRRTDEYGGDRSLLLRQVIGAVRDAWPAELPLFVRLSAIDWAEGGLTINDSIAVVEKLRTLGVDLVDVSSGGLAAPTGTYPGYQVPFAAAIRSATGVPVAAVGLLAEPSDVHDVLAQGHADAVFAGRAFLRDPNWARRVLSSSAVSLRWPDQYQWAIADE